jgi:hypothetical protein
MGGHVACTGEMRKAYSIMVRKPEWKRPLGRPRYRWEVDVRMGIGEKGRECVDWIRLAQDRDQWWDLVNMVMNILVIH